MQWAASGADVMISTGISYNTIVVSMVQTIGVTLPTEHAQYLHTDIISVGQLRRPKRTRNGDTNGRAGIQTASWRLRGLQSSQIKVYVLLGGPSLFILQDAE